MQFNIDARRHVINLPVLRSALLDADPAAMIDNAKDPAMLRVATCLDGTALLRVFGAAGYPLPEVCLEQVPSECCGGCGG